MRKSGRFVLSALFISLLIAFNARTQTTSPPIYDDNDNPIDLSIEKLPPPKKPAPKPTAPPQAALPQAAPKPLPPAATVTTTTTTTEEAPAPIPEPAAPPQAALPQVATPQTEPQAATPPEAPVVEETVTTTTTTTVVPAPVSPPPAAMPPVVSPPVVMPPAPPPPSETVTTATLPTIPAGDGHPPRDAGMDIATALAVTFDKYDNNSLSSQDTVDVFKLYGRGGEGVGVILIPKHPMMQLSVALLGETGEMLSQTQAPQPGSPLSFQTSPLDSNRTIYIQVKDSNLPEEAPPFELRQYSLELKPIAPPEPVAAPASQTAPQAAVEAAPAVVKPSAPPPSPKPMAKKGKPVSLFSGSMLYTLIGIFILGGLAAVLVVLRRKRSKPAEVD